MERMQENYVPEDVIAYVTNTFVQSVVIKLSSFPPKNACKNRYVSGVPTSFQSISITLNHMYYEEAHLYFSRPFNQYIFFENISKVEKCGQQQQWKQEGSKSIKLVCARERKADVYGCAYVCTLFMHVYAFVGRMACQKNEEGGLRSYKEVFIQNCYRYNCVEYG